MKSRKKASATPRKNSGKHKHKNSATISRAQKLTINSPGISTKSTLPPERLQKVLASIGVDSRRKIEQLIIDGQVRVNGKVASLGDKVVAGNKVTIGNIEVTIVEQNHPLPRVIVYHKPEGEVCTRNDPEGRRTVFQSLPALPNGRWVNVGRLDINTSGLLLFTDDGVLANRLMHPSAEIERHYAVRVLGDVQQEHIDQLTTGVMLDDGMSHFLTFQDLGGEGANHWYRVSLKSGRFREVRRLWEALNFKVSRLIRIQFGEIILPQNLPSGSYQDLSEAAVKRMVEMIDMPTKSYTGLYGRGRRLRRNDNQTHNHKHKNHQYQGDRQGGQQGYEHGNGGYNNHHNRGNRSGYQQDSRARQGGNGGYNSGYNSSNGGSHQGGDQGGHRGGQGQHSGGNRHWSNDQRGQGNGNSQRHYNNANPFSNGNNQTKPGYKSNGNRNGGHYANQNGNVAGSDAQQGNLSHAKPYQKSSNGGRGGYQGGGNQGNGYGNKNHHKNGYQQGYKKKGYQQKNYGRSYDDQSFLGNPEDLYGNGHPHKDLSDSGNRTNGNRSHTNGNRPNNGNRSSRNSNGNRNSRNKH